MAATSAPVLSVAALFTPSTCNVQKVRKLNGHNPIPGRFDSLENNDELAMKMRAATILIKASLLPHGWVACLKDRFGPGGTSKRTKVYE
ncbi:hypothetical protein AX17_006775, partial [Amanita inopinata Kibby_2008]